ncbi:MAG TPA: hypothetical protein VMT69_12100, partial [Kineosporiaceae bacterium]|nr:hypothetical protein [Kineosporiaceae bacterium]
MAQGVVQGFTVWARGRAALEPDVVETLTDLKGTYLGDAAPGRWRSGELRELLLEVIPRKVTADDAWYASVVPTTRAFLTYLHQHGQLHPASAPLSSLLAELDDVAGEFTDAVHDPARFGMAKSLLARVGLPAGQLMDQESLDEAMARFNALPFEERDAALGQFAPTRVEEEPGEDEPVVLPGVRLAPTAELAEAARSSRTIVELEQLDRWLRTGRAVTGTGVLTLKEARSLQVTLGWEAPDDAESAPPDLDDDLPRRTARSARDMPRLDRLWTVAEAVGVLDVHTTRVYAGPARPVLRALATRSPGADEKLLAFWQQAFDELLLTSQPLPFRIGVDPHVVLGVVMGVVMHGLLTAYEGDECSVAELLDEAFQDVAPGEIFVPEAMRGVVALRVLERLGQFADLGAVAPIAGAAQPVALTPLGVHGLRTAVVARGGEAPAVGDVAGQPAEVAVDQILLAGPALAAELLLEWLGDRPRGEALAEVMPVLRGQPAALRYRVLSLLVPLEGVLDELRAIAPGDPLLGPLVLALSADFAALAAVAKRFPDGPDDIDEDAVAQLAVVVQGLAWRDLEMPPAYRRTLVVDSLARAVFELEPPVRSGDVDADHWSLLDEATVLRMVDCEHPEVDVVLDAIA